MATREDVAPPLLSVTMYRCRDSLLLASESSSLLAGSLDIISNMVFLRMGFIELSLTLYSTKLTKMCTCKIFDVGDCLVIQFVVD